MTENYQDRRDTLFESSDYLAGTLAQCAFIERRFYRDQNSDETEDVGDALVRLYLALLRYTAQIQKELSASRTRRLLDSLTEIADVPLTELKSSVEAELQGLRGRIELGQHLERGDEAERILSEISRVAKDLKHSFDVSSISKLRLVVGALYDSHANENEDFCLKGTREDLLRQISHWAGSQDEFMFCLQGMAGTGKSTVARTVARDLQRRGLLGATFFFKRGETDRENASYFVSTIARLLADRHPGIRRGVLDAVNNDPQIGGKHLSEQIDKLLYHPLNNFHPESPQTIVIVIDALDECEGRNHIVTILNHLFRLQDIDTLRFRVFLTARPEMDIHRGLMDGLEGGPKEKRHRDLVLNELPLPVIEEDIRLFLNDKLSKIRVEESVFDIDWPGNDQIERLVKMATPLFIFAATICRFIVESGSEGPKERLQEFLSDPATASEDQMDRTYLPVLRKFLAGGTEKTNEKSKKQFEETVGVIILLVDPLSLTALSRLINLPIDQLCNRLQRLHSVLSVPKDHDAPVCTLHSSFRDFLLGTDGFFQIREQDSHGKIASHCLRVMESGLRHNLCGLPSYGTELHSLDQRTIDQQIPAELRYASCFWVHHIQRSKDRISDADVLSFLEEHFLHWLEALALMGRNTDAIEMINTLKSGTTVS